MALTGSMGAGIAGMKAYMDALNVVGNNVANVNTYGYKPGRVTFRESIYNTQTAGSDGTDTVGGTNPSQIGYGASIGTIDLDMTTQGLESTGMPSDAAIVGDGFYLLGDKTGVDVDNLESLSLSRVGDFKFDQDGYLTDGAGNIVYGFVTCNATVAADGTVTQQNKAGPDGNGISTQLVPIRLPLAAAEDGPGDPPAYKIGDPIFPGVDGNGFNTKVDEDGEIDGIPTSGCIGKEDVTIDKNGKITCTSSNGDPVVVGYIALATVPNPNGLTHTDGPYYKAEGGAGDITITTAGSAVKGFLNNKTDEKDGTQKLPEGTGTLLMSGFLEQSGTDLATEFANMIIYQRGYQANTRIVTVTDTMLEELINMKR